MSAPIGILLVPTIRMVRKRKKAAGAKPGRRPNEDPPHPFKVSGTDGLWRDLGRLKGRRYFGSTESEVAKRLIEERLRDLAEKGWLPMPGSDKDAKE